MVLKDCQSQNLQPMVGEVGEVGEGEADELTGFGGSWSCSGSDTLYCGVQYSITAAQTDCDKCMKEQLKCGGRRGRWECGDVFLSLRKANLVLALIPVWNVRCLRQSVGC